MSIDLKYWITPKGQVVEPSLYHIGAVIADPKKFGETEETLRVTFDKHQEIMSRTAEGKSREEILTRVLERGFIRIRKHNIRRMQKWSVELYKMSRKKAVYISNWAKWMIDGGVDDIYADVVVTDLKTYVKDEGSLTDLAAFNEAFDGEYSSLVVSGMQVYEVALNVLGNSAVHDYDMKFNLTEDDVHKFDDWITYAGKISLGEISHRAEIQIYTRKMSGGC